MSRVDFGWQPMGARGAPQTVTIMNTGARPLVIERAVLEGPHAGDFTIVAESFSHVEIWPGCRCTVDVRFEPSGPGIREAVLLLVGRKPAGVFRIPVTGQCTATESSAAGCEPVLVEENLKVAVPVEIDGAGRAGEVAVSCGRSWTTSRPDGDGCEAVLFQEMTFVVPVAVTLTGECNGEGFAPVVCEFLFTQMACVELPIRVGAEVACTPAACCTEPIHVDDRENGEIQP